MQPIKNINDDKKKKTKNKFQRASKLNETKNFARHPIHICVW